MQVHYYLCEFSDIILCDLTNFWPQLATYRSWW